MPDGLVEMKVTILAEIGTMESIWNNLGYYEAQGLKIIDIVETK